MKATTEEIIQAYKETGSVWKAGKKLGMAGQSVHERLKAVGYRLVSDTWTAEELEELESLAEQLTIAQIANRLGRPYNGVAIKLSRLGLGNRFGNKSSKKPKRNGKYRKEQVLTYIRDMETSGTKITQYAKQNGLETENLTYAIQNLDAEWWERYAQANAKKPKTACPYCEQEFWPQSGKQIYCKRHCANQARTDRDYFGGRRRETVGLADGQCQLCGQVGMKGLSSHHVLGKENDPDNNYLIALCQGCHQIVTLVAGRRFAATEEAWEVLIQLVLMRKNGAQSNMLGVFASVDINLLTEENKEDFDW
jgi:hypothetical protein